MAECPFSDEPKYILLAFYLGRRKLLNCLALSRITKDLLHTFEETPNNNSTKYVSFITACCLCKEKEIIFKEYWLQYHNHKDASSDERSENAKTEEEVDDAWNDILQLWIEVETSNKDPPSHHNILLSYERACADVLKKHDVDVLCYLKHRYNEEEDLNNWVFIIDSVKEELEYCREEIEGKCGTVMSVPKCKGVRKAKTWGLASVFLTLFVDDKARTYAKCLQSCRQTGIQIRASRQPVAVVARYLICHKCLGKRDVENYISILEVLTSFYHDLGIKRMPKQLGREIDNRQKSANDAKDDFAQVRKSSRALGSYKKYSTLIYDVGDSDSSGDEASVSDRNNTRCKRKTSNDSWKRELKKPRLSSSQESSREDVDASSSKKETSPSKTTSSDIKTSVVIVTSAPLPHKKACISPVKSLAKVNTGQRLISKVSLPQILPKSSSSDSKTYSSTVITPKLPFRPITSFAKLITLPVSTTQQPNGIMVNKPNQLLLLTSMPSDTSTKLTLAKPSPAFKSNPSTAAKNRSSSLDSSAKNVPFSKAGSTSAKRRSDSISGLMTDQSPKFVIQVVGNDMDNAPVAKKVTEVKSGSIFFLSPVSGDSANFLRSVVDKSLNGSGHRIFNSVPLKSLQNGVALEKASGNVKSSSSVGTTNNVSGSTKTNSLVLTKFPTSSLSQLPFVKLNRSVLSMPKIHPGTTQTSKSTASRLKKMNKANEKLDSPGNSETFLSKASMNAATGLKPSTTVVVVPSTISETSPTLTKKSSSDNIQSPFKAQCKKKQAKQVIKCLPTVLAEYLLSIMPSNKPEKRKKKRNDKSSLLMPMPYESHFLCITDTIKQHGWKAYWYRKCRCSRYREKILEAQEVEQESALATEELIEKKLIPKHLSARSKMFLSKLKDGENKIENLEVEGATVRGDDNSNMAKSSNPVQTTETEAEDSNIVLENVKYLGCGSMPSTSCTTPRSEKLSPIKRKISSGTKSISPQFKENENNSPPSSGKSLKARYCRDKNGNWMAVNDENDVNESENPVVSRISKRVPVNLGQYFTDGDHMSKDIQLELITSNENNRGSSIRQKGRIMRALLSQLEEEKYGLSAEDDVTKSVCFVQFKDKSLSDPTFEVVAPTSKCFSDYPALSSNVMYRETERSLAFQSLIEKPEDQPDFIDLRMRKEKDVLMSYIKSDISQYKVPRRRKNPQNPPVLKTKAMSPQKEDFEEPDQNKIEHNSCALVSTLENMWKQGNERPNIPSTIMQRQIENNSMLSAFKTPPSNKIKLKVLSWRARRRQIEKQIEQQAIYCLPELGNGIRTVLTVKNAKFAVSVVNTSKMLEDNKFKLYGIKRRRRRKWSRVKTDFGNKTRIGLAAQKSSAFEERASSSKYWPPIKRKLGANRTTASTSLKKCFPNEKKGNNSKVSLNKEARSPRSSKGKYKVLMVVNSEIGGNIAKMCEEEYSEEKFASTAPKTSSASPMDSTDSIPDAFSQEAKDVVGCDTIDESNRVNESLPTAQFSEDNRKILLDVKSEAQVEQLQKELSISEVTAISITDKTLATSNKQQQEEDDSKFPTAMDDGIVSNSACEVIKKIMEDVKYETEGDVVKDCQNKKLCSEPTNGGNSQQVNDSLSYPQSEMPLLAPDSTKISVRGDVASEDVTKDNRKILLNIKSEKAEDFINQLPVLEKKDCTEITSSSVSDIPDTLQACAKDSCSASSDPEHIKAQTTLEPTKQQTVPSSISSETLDENADTEHADLKTTIENQELVSHHVTKEEIAPEDPLHEINRSTESLDFIKDANMDFDLSSLNSEESRSNSPDKLTNSYSSSKSGNSENEVVARGHKRSQVRGTRAMSSECTKQWDNNDVELNRKVECDGNNLARQIKAEKDIEINLQMHKEDNCEQEESETEENCSSEISCLEMDIIEFNFPDDGDDDVDVDDCLTESYEYDNSRMKTKSKSNYISRKNAIEMLCSEDDDKTWIENWQALSLPLEIQTSYSKPLNLCEVYKDLNKIISNRKTKTHNEKSAPQSPLNENHAKNLRRIVMSVDRISPFVGRKCTLPRLQKVLLLSKGKTPLKNYSWSVAKTKNQRISKRDNWINGHLRCYMKQHHKKKNLLRAANRSLHCSSPPEIPKELPCSRFAKSPLHKHSNSSIHSGGIQRGVESSQSSQSGSDFVPNECDILSVQPSTSRSYLLNYAFDNRSTTSTTTSRPNVIDTRPMKEKLHRIRQDVSKHTLDGSYWSSAMNAKKSKSTKPALRRSRRSKSDDHMPASRGKGNKRKRAGISCLLQESNSLEVAESSLLESYKNHALQSTLSSDQTKVSCSDDVLHSLFTSRMDVKRIRSWMWDSDSPKPLRLHSAGKSAFSEITRKKLSIPAVRAGSRGKFKQGSEGRKPSKGEREYFSDSESQSRSHCEIKKKPSDAIVSLVRCAYPISPRRDSPPEKKSTSSSSSSRLLSSIAEICAKKTVTRRGNTAGMHLRPRDTTDQDTMAEIEVDTFDNEEHACSSASLLGKNKFLGSSVGNNLPLKNDHRRNSDDINSTRSCRVSRRQSIRNFRSPEDRKGIKRLTVRNNDGIGEKKQRARSEETSLPRSGETDEAGEKIQALRESVYAEIRTVSGGSPRQNTRNVGSKLRTKLRKSPVVPSSPKATVTCDSRRALSRYSTEGSFISRLLECESPEGGNSDVEGK